MALDRVLYDNFIVFELDVPNRTQKGRRIQKALPNQIDLAIHRVFNIGVIGFILRKL
jgi:hypothetical protein